MSKANQHRSAAGLREVRTFTGAQLRAKGNETAGADGYAAVFNQVTDLGWFREVIRPGAFARAITEKQDVRCLQNHDDNLVLGRTKNETLALQEDSKGLKFSCDFPDTQTAKDLRALLDRGDVDSCSFGFIVRKQTWTEERLEDGTIQDTREIQDVDLFDVSIVTFPAYSGTSCEGRAKTSDLWPDGVPAEIRSRRNRRARRTQRDNTGYDDVTEKCQCACAECMSGDCVDCSDPDCDDPYCDHQAQDVEGQPDIASRKPKGSQTRADKKTKRVDGEDLTADCFLIVGDPDDPSTWKLPWKFSTEEKTKNHLRNALARFSQLKGVSDEDKQKAWEKLTKLCKEHDIDVSDEEAKSAPAFAEIQKRQDKLRAVQASL